MGFFSKNTITDYVRAGDLAGAEASLADGDDINERRSFGQTPLINGCRSVEIVAWLLDRGADPTLIDSNNMCVLMCAINRGYDATALFLLDRVGDRLELNRQGYCGRTVLHEAVKKEQVPVVRTLLERGADPEAQIYGNGENCLDLAKAKVSPASIEIQELLDEYMHLGSAIMARNIGALNAIIQRKNQQFDEAQWIEALPGTEVLTNTTGHHRVFFHVVQNEAHEAGVWLIEKATQKANVSVMDFAATFKFESLDWNLLHVAAANHKLPMVQYLLETCRMDPRASGASGVLPIDLVDVAKPDGLQIHFILQQCARKMQFRDSSLAIQERGSSLVTYEELVPLTSAVTSVFDLRLIFSLGTTAALARGELKELLRQAFQQVITEKLVFEDRDAIFFKMVLRECHKRKLLTDVELAEWDLKATKVNMESAQWVDEIKRSLQTLAWRVETVETRLSTLRNSFNNLRLALVEREEQEKRRARIKQLVSVASTAMALCGGPAFEKVFDAVVDASDPIKLLIAACNVTEEQAVEFVAGKATDLFRDGVESLLEDAMIEPREFVDVLREAIKIDQDEAATVSAALAKVTVASGEPVADLQAPDATALPATQVGAVMVENTEKCNLAIANGEEREEEEEEGVEDLEAFPYHYAVQFSQGDITKFHTIVDHIDSEDGDINAATAVWVAVGGSKQRSSSNNNSRQRLCLTAAIYASYLGYVDIVRYFLTRQDVHLGEKKFVTIGRAQSNINVA